MVKGYTFVIIIETDNLETYVIQLYRVVRDFNMGAPAHVYDLLSQINIMLGDRRWVFVLAYVFPARNHVARLGKDISDRLYTLSRMIRPLEELLDWNMGLGVNHLDYMDVMIPDQTQDPVNFDSALGITNQLNGLTLGQAATQGNVVNAWNSMALFGS